MRTHSTSCGLGFECHQWSINELLLSALIEEASRAICHALTILIWPIVTFLVNLGCVIFGILVLAHYSTLVTNEKQVAIHWRRSIDWFRDDPSIRSVVRKTRVNLVETNRRGRSWSPTIRIRFIFVRTRNLVSTTTKVIIAIPMNSLDWRVRPTVFDVSMSPSVSSMKPSDTISTQPGAIDWLNSSVRNPG